MLGLKTFGMGVLGWFIAAMVLFVLQDALKAAGEGAWYFGLLLQWVFAVWFALRWRQNELVAKARREEGWKDAPPPDATAGG